MSRHTQLCSRSREWLSLRLDGELSELEQALLGAHLQRCGECREYEQDVATATAALRAARLEPLPRPIELPRRTRVSLRVMQAGAAAAVVLAATALGSLYGVTRSGEGTSTVAARASGDVVAYFDEVAELRELRRAQLQEEHLHLPRNRDLSV